MYRKDETPGRGEYVCTRCGKVIVLETDVEPLPRCPRCFNTKFDRKEP